jgi:transitional endoplasmic reticulum ATPase
MASQDYDIRPDTETFEVSGASVTLVDAPGVLAAAAAGAVPLLRDVTFPAPVDTVRMSVRRLDDGPVPIHRFRAEIQLVGYSFTRSTLGPALTLAGPVGTLFARRLASGDPTAAKIAAGADRVATEASRLLNRRPPAANEAPAPIERQTEIREDPATGLRATISYPPPVERPTAPVITVTAEVASQLASPAHLRSLATIVFTLIAEVVERPLTGRRYRIGRLSGAASAPPTSDTVTLDQVGGLDEVVAQFREIATSFNHPHVMARWGARRPQGILLYGPPGTGKTMLSRALANEIGAAFKEIRTPEILDKWLGGSERNIKNIFTEARRYREPTVMLFDEFDSIISYAGAGGDAASQAVNAVAGLFKQEMNNLIEANPNVIVVATTNFPNRVDASLVRSGRFDIKLAIPTPDEAGRAVIFAKMIRELIGRLETPGFRMFAADVDVGALATLSAGFTGADIKEVLRRVQLAKAMQEAQGGRTTPIGQADLVAAIASVRG